MSDNHWAKKPSNPGPTSPEGKAISSKNARRHGCCAVDAASLLASESVEDFKALEAMWCKAFAPTDETERHLVTDLVNADWLLQRSTQTVLDIETRLYSEAPNPLDWTELQQRTLGRFLRYKTAHSNAVLKARKAIEDYRKGRLNEQILKSRASKQATASKPQPPKTEPTWKEHLENMRNKAISLGFTPPEPGTL
jgi:hypothetical protein